MTTTIAVADVSQDLKGEIEEASGVVYRIDSTELREAASTEYKRMGALLTAAEEERTKITKPLNEAIRATNEFFRKLVAPLESARGALSRAMLAWDDECERKRRAALAEAARIADEERKRLHAKAAEAKASGHTEAAAALQSTAEMVAPPPVAAAPKLSGESKRELWHAEVFDPAALYRAVANGEVDMAVIEPNMAVLNQRARALKGAMSVPGVRAVPNKILATSRS